MRTQQQEDSERLHAPVVCCPRCGSRPALRLAGMLVEVARLAAPDRMVGSYKCQRRGCGTIYYLTAAAYQRGRPLEGGPPD